jgi:hypothetical protein
MHDSGRSLHRSLQLGAEWKRQKPEEIVAKLRQIGALASQVQSRAEAILPIGVTEVTYYLYGRLSRCKPISN